MSGVCSAASRLDLGRDYALRFAVAHDDRETGADRTQLTVGFGLRF